MENRVLSDTLSRPSLPKREIPRTYGADKVLSKIYEPEQSLASSFIKNLKKAGVSIVITNKEVFALLLTLLLSGLLLLLYLKLVF